MKPILASSEYSVLESFAASEVLLAFDFDGTLAPIVRSPGDAQMRAETRRLLGHACRSYPCAVISGRARDDVRARVEPVPAERVVGNHGSEPAPNMAELEGEIARAKPGIMAALAGLEHVELEDKRFSLSIHYRKSPDQREARRAIARALKPFEKWLRVVGGKAVFNVTPHAAPHKGTALELMRNRLGVGRAVFVGDDETDEDVFTRGRPDELLSIRVGMHRGSAARYYIRDQREIDTLLRRLLALRPAQRTSIDASAPAASTLMLEK
ncbi:MAG: trehalose-phosphatase [Deltaproteobacteria bacterium]|nr:trehalose-phosphatase [Nannocystaceae bacterium]